MDTTSLAQPARPSTTTTNKTRRSCDACGKPSGSISAGIGFPVVRDRETGEWFHVRCRPGATADAAVLAEFDA